LILFYLFAVLFNAAYYGRTLALVLDGGVILWSVSPILYQPNIAPLVAHLVIFGPVCLCVGYVADLMVREVRRREREVGVLVAQQARRGREYARLAALHQAGIAVSAHLDAQRVMETVVHELAISLGYAFVGIYVRAGDVLCLCAQAGFATPLERIADDAGVIGRVCRTARGALVPDVRGDPDYLGGDERVRSEVCVPILRDGMVIGVVNVESSDRLDRDDLEVLELFAQQIGAALANARTHAAMSEAARRDDMTGALNHRAVFAALEQNIAAARTAQCSLALLYLDVDGFKRLNDRHGHAFGDDVLRACVREIEAVLPPAALLGRYGGDEFVVILPGADREQGVSAAETIRARVTARRFPEVASGEPSCLTVSIGVACMPEHATTIAALLAMADRALYAAKARGRDQVCAAPRSIAA
jgi:diguanylate cyclase (GGDEF)-like protein